MNILQVQPCIVPSNLRNELPDPHTPWQVSKRVFSSLQEPAPSARYKKTQVLPEDKEWRFIWRYFHADKPTRYEIKRIWCVHERHQQRAFEFHLSNQEREAEKFAPTWQNEPRAAQRAVVIDRWMQETAPFSPFQYQEADGRIRSWKQTKILPLWHGTREEICESICSSGFVYFGKTSLGAFGAGDPQNTDEGYFGSGIYFTNSPRYAADIYSKGHMLLAWVSMRHPFPVVGDSKQSDMEHLRGKGAYKQYNTHYVPVVPVEDDPHCAIYYPAQPGETPICDEYVVFQTAQTLPRYWIELDIALPYLMVPSDEPQFVEQLIPHLRHFLQNPEVDKDLKLRRVLGQELGILLNLPNDDDLSDSQIELYHQLTQLLIQGKIDKTARNIIVGIFPSQASSSNPQPNLSESQPSSSSSSSSSSSEKQKSANSEEKIDWIHKNNGRIFDLGLSLDDLVAFLSNPEIGKRIEVMDLSKQPEQVVLKFIKYCPNLNQLFIKDCKINPEGAAEIVKLQNLTSLDLRWNHIGDTGASSIATLQNLTSLDLRWNHIGDTGAASIAKLQNLTSLDLGDNHIGEEGASSIAKLQNLTSLDLGDNHIGDTGASSIAKLQNLTSLTLWGNRIGDTGAASIAKLQNLTSLDLGDNHIGDTGASSIAKLQNLTRLNLEGNQIGDTGAASIATLQNLTNLNLRDNKIGDQGVAEILAKFPEAYIRDQREEVKIESRCTCQ